MLSRLGSWAACLELGCSAPVGSGTAFVHPCGVHSVMLCALGLLHGPPWLGLVWGRFGVGLGSVWGRFGIGLGSVWGRFGVGLGRKACINHGFYMFSGSTMVDHGSGFEPRV